MEWIYLVLAVVVLIVGLGVVVVNRRRTAAVAPPRASCSSAAAHSRLRSHRRRRSTPEVAGPATTVAPPVAVELERPNFRSRMSKARNALAGTLLGIRSRSGITNETWDDLEEALLRADVGVRVTDDLLDGSADEGEGEGDHGTRAAARRTAGRDGRSPLDCRPNAALRRRCPMGPTSGSSSASTASARPRPSARSARSRRLWGDR